MALTSFSVPAQERYFEDYVAGSVYEFGSVLVEEEEIIAFGKHFDPQVFHVDPVGARKTEFGGIVASGWHIGAMESRMFKEHFLTKVASLGSPGIDRLRWIEPVRPGDTLSIRVTILETIRSRTKPDRGVVRTLTDVMNQRGQVVMTVEGASIIGCRKSG